MKPSLLTVFSLAFLFTCNALAQRPTVPVECFDTTDASVGLLVTPDAEGRPAKVRLLDEKIERLMQPETQELTAGDQEGHAVVRESEPQGFAAGTVFKSEPNRIGSFNLHVLDSNRTELQTFACRPPEWTPRGSCMNRVSKELAALNWGTYHHPVPGITRKAEWTRVTFLGSVLDSLSFRSYYDPRAKNWAGHHSGIEIHVSKISILGTLEGKLIDLDSKCDYRAVRVVVPLASSSTATEETCKGSDLSPLISRLCRQYFPASRPE